ncbi:hypothetical protein RIE95_05790 [Acidithiobacillus thiooxidans]|uniref:hypothetical protein n=1 Tax=Acidithiobacillus thiooxidans TaxID=930 RepID=UPI002867609F|nr:hypothetical protein [Acidithiobacillus thiooxidans]MDR7926505.1 hypothetical protein [Acidithiobacillus thiooxidans]
MRANGTDNLLTIGLFHVALVASANRESSDLLVDGLREMITGLHALMDQEHFKIEFFNGQDLERDLLDLEHLILLMLEEARNESKSLERQCALSQLLDALTGLRWEVVHHTRNNSHRLKAFDTMNNDNQLSNIKLHRLKTH